MAHDLVIRGGDVIDGTGAPARNADMAVDNGKIVAVGDVSGAGGARFAPTAQSSHRASSTFTRTTTGRRRGRRACRRRITMA